jgi:hypothetical protein
VDGLPDLANGAALERERRGLDHRLVAVVEGVEPALRVELEAALRGAEDREPPTTLAREGDEAVEERLVGRGRPDRVAGDDRHAADHAVGEERELVVGEEVRLVGPEHERGEGVGAPGRDEVASQRPLARLLP